MANRISLYLVQHGEAKSEEEDPKRQLTGKGKEEVSRVAACVARLGIKVKIYHSDKLRAKQTAELFGNELKSEKGIEEIKGIAPLDDIQIALELIKKSDEPIMIVGHLPHLSKVASYLLTGDQSRELVKFRMGGVVCLTKVNEKWLLSWIITPDNTLTA